MSRYFLLTDLFLQYTFSFAKERQFIEAVTSNWYLVICHGSFIPEKFDLKINRFMKTP